MDNIIERKDRKSIGCLEKESDKLKVYFAAPFILRIWPITMIKLQNFYSLSFFAGRIIVLESRKETQKFNFVIRVKRECLFELREGKQNSYIS